MAARKRYNIVGKVPASKQAPRKKTRGAERKKKKAEEDAREPSGHRSTPHGDLRGRFVGRRAEPNRHQTPLVTVFGGGITGLSVAHELIERGFEVQLVEKRTSVEDEYEVEVGGIAANQLGAVKEELSRLHPYLFALREQEEYCAAVEGGEIEDRDVAEFIDEINELKKADHLAEVPKAGLFEAEKRNDRQIGALRALRAPPMQRTREPVAVPETIRFGDPREEAPLLLAELEESDERARDLLDRFGFFANRRKPSAASRKKFVAEVESFPDEHLVTTREKLDAIARKLCDALIERIGRLRIDIMVAERFGAEEPGFREDLRNVCDERILRREMMVVEIRGHASGEVSGFEAREIGRLRGRLVKKLLLQRMQEILRTKRREWLASNLGLLAKALEDSFGRLPAGWRGDPTDAFIENLDRHFVVISHGAFEPLGHPPRRRDRIRSNRVDFRALEVLLPGEHGYRYFPAYYRHLFDTMRRTPILDAEGEETGRTAFSQLVTPPAVAISLATSRRVESIARRRPKSLKEIREGLRVMLEDMGITGRDMQLYFLRMFVFMTSCKERRNEYGKLSWLEFLDGRAEHAEGGIKNQTRFSPGAEELLRETAQALVAMDAEETDACTYALNSVQLLLDYQGEGSGSDMTLNGPTSRAWLRHWKRYLRRQGVQFYRGELTDLVEDPNDPNGGLLPVAQGKLDEESAPRAPIPENPSYRYLGLSPERNAAEIAPLPDFYVLALPFDQAAKIAWRAREGRLPLDGDWAALATMDAKCIRRDDHGHDLVQLNEANPDAVDGTLRDPEGRPLNPSVYPLRDLSGIQFFFPSQVRIGLGHVVYPLSEWGLTSISQVNHWRTRLSPRGVFLGHVSVDIGDFYQKHSIDPKRPIRYLAMTDPDIRKELAVRKTAWRSEWWEIAVRTWDQIVQRLDPELAASVEPPRYYHMDSGLVLRPTKERTYQVAGRELRYFPFRIARNDTPFLINLPGQWELRPGLNGQPGERHGHAEAMKPHDPWYRISNGRWVLAGTYMATEIRMMTMEACNESARRAVNAILHELLTHAGDSRYNSQGKLLGELCRTFDPYLHEVDDLEPLKQLDKALFEEGLPHFVEILGIERLVEAMPQVDPKQRTATKLARALEKTRRGYEDDWGFLSQVFDVYRAPGKQMLRNLREGLENLGTAENLQQAIRMVADFVDEARKPRP